MENEIRWPEVIEQIIAAGGTLTKIALECDFPSAGAVHDLKSGRKTTCNYERGAKLVAMHTKMMRQAARKAEDAGSAKV